MRAIRSIFTGTVFSGESRWKDARFSHNDCYESSLQYESMPPYREFYEEGEIDGNGVFIKNQ